MKHSLVVFSLMAMSGLACADGFNYTYAQVNYGTVDIDNNPVDGDGLGLNGYFGVTDDLNIVGSWQTADFGGIRANVTSMIEVNAGVTWIDLSTSGNDTGFNGSVLYNFTDTFSVGLSGDWVDERESNSSYPFVSVGFLAIGRRTC